MNFNTRKREDGFQITVGDMRLNVCPMTSSEITKLREAHTKIKRGVEKTNGAAMTAEMFDRIVLDWFPLLDKDSKPVPGSGANDEAGNPLECTSRNKRVVYEHNADFVADVLKETEEVDADRRQGLVGNLPPGLSGTSAQGK